MNIHDLSAMPGAWRARSLPVIVQVEFAGCDGLLETLEGTVAYKQGDAILTGTQGERWPVQHDVFFLKYEPVEGTSPGQPGAYQKRTQYVWVWKADQDVDIELSHGRGTLHAHPGDLIIQYAPGDLAVIQPDIYAHHYTRLDE